MDDISELFDIDQLDQLLNFLSSSPPPPSTSTDLQKQNTSISSQTQSSDLVITNHVPKKKSIVTDNIVDDQVQDQPEKKEIVVLEKKKVTRRDVERQRRRDMAKLYQRLRLLIPAKYLMGKRSISDHLEEIVDYVKDLRKNIDELERKRGSLKEMKSKICSSDDHQLAPSSSSMRLTDQNINNVNDDDDYEDRIRVKSCNEEVEISVKGGISLSKVIRVLMKEGLIVNSCVSSTVDQMLLHIIQSKVNTREDIDLARLRHKLMSIYYE